MIVRLENGEPAARPTKPCPGDKTLMDMMADLKPCRATDGCRVELDGECQHGHVSWLKHLGLI